MKNRTNIAPWLFVAALCAGAFGAPWILPWAEAQRVGYVEKQKVGTGTATGMSAFADQLAPNPVASKVLTSRGTDNRVEWSDAPNPLPTGSVGEVAGITAITATRTVVLTGTQTSIGTQTYSYTQSKTNTGTNTQTGATGTYTYTATGTPTGSRTGTITTTNTKTGTYTYTNTGTSTGTQTYGSTGTVTSSATGTTATTGTEWTSINGALAAGDNIYFTKASGTDTFTSVLMSEEPKILAIVPHDYDPFGTLYIGSAYTNATLRGRGLRHGELELADSGATETYVVCGASGEIDIQEMLIDIKSTNTGVEDYERRLVWPAGWWKSVLRARVTANQAALRVYVFDTSTPGAVGTQVMAWTTDNFSNTTYANFVNETYQANDYNIASGRWMYIVIRAVCLGAANVYLQTGPTASPTPFPSRIYTPYAVDPCHLATASTKGCMSANDKTIIDSITTTPTSYAVPKADYYGRLTTWVPIAVTQACASTASDLTITTTTSVVSISNYTPRADTNKLRITAHWSGYATGGAATVVSYVNAVTSGNTVQIQSTQGVTSLASGYAADVSKYAVEWNSNWSSSTTFNLRIGTTAGSLLIPLNTQSSYYSACLTIEELRI